MAFHTAILRPPPTHLTSAPTPFLPNAHAAGPFITGLTATANPTTQLILSLMDTDPFFNTARGFAACIYLLDTHTHGYDTGFEANRWNMYVSSAIVRHASYAAAVAARLDKEAHRCYVRLYEAFRGRFEDAYALYQEGGNIAVGKQNELIQLERSLTLETFGVFPHLFEIVNNTNQERMNRFEREMARMDGSWGVSPIMTNQYARAVMKVLKKEWVVLGDASDVLNRRGQRYERWMLLKRAMGYAERAVERGWIDGVWRDPLREVERNLPRTVVGVPAAGRVVRVPAALDGWGGQNDWQTRLGTTGMREL
ncbi:hypothetical protein MMC21_006443 [Puttea exsequens]|nr:hypothetical protein [Puttea exsequens]